MNKYREDAFSRFGGLWVSTGGQQGGGFDLFGGWDSGMSMAEADNSVENAGARQAIAALKEHIRQMDKIFSDTFGESFVPLLLSEARVNVEEMKRPEGYDDLDCNIFIRSMLEGLMFRDNDGEPVVLVETWHNADLLARYIYSQDYVGRLFVAYQKLFETMRDKVLGKTGTNYWTDYARKYQVDGLKIIEQAEIAEDLLGNEGEADMMSAIVMGLIISAGQGGVFPSTLSEAFMAFHDALSALLGEEYLVQQVIDNRCYHAICYFALMPHDFHSALPMAQSPAYQRNAYIEKGRLLKLMADRIAFSPNENINLATAEALCDFLSINNFLIETDLVGFAKQEIIGFAYSVFSVILRVVPLSALKNTEAFWETPIIKGFFYDLPYTELFIWEKSNYERDSCDVRGELIDRINENIDAEQIVCLDADFFVFIDIIARNIKDREMRELIGNIEEIRSLPYGYSDDLYDKLHDLIRDRHTRRLFAAIEDTFVSRTADAAERLISILKETGEDISLAYDTSLTEAIKELAVDNKLGYNDVSASVRADLNLAALDAESRDKIYALVSTGEYLLGDTTMPSFAPSVSQLCSALECLLNEVVYKPYYFEVARICMKQGNRYFYRDRDVSNKYFGNIPFAMSMKHGKLSPMTLNNLSMLMQNIVMDSGRRALFQNVSGQYFKPNADIFGLLSEISENVELIRDDRNRASHGELVSHEEACDIRTKVYKNEGKHALTPNEMLIKISACLK